MKREIALRRDVRVSDVRGIQVESDYICPGYRLIVPRRSRISETGELVLFRLTPSKGSDWRGFWARWGNAAMKGKPGPAVKIEVAQQSKGEQLAWKRSERGYSGHWTVPLEDGTCRVAIDRGAAVFRGILSMRLVWAFDAAVADPGMMCQVVEQ